VSISVQTFKELGKFKSKESATVLGAALVDDILVVIFLAILMSLLTASDISLTMVIGKKVLFFFIAGLIAWKVIPWLLKGFARLKINEPIISGGILICLGLSIFAEGLGVAGIIGAFLAGVGISQTSFKHEIEHKLEPIAYAIFVPVFFVSIGLSIRFDGIQENLMFTILLSLLAIASKLIGSGLGARLTGFNNRSSLIIGAGMVSRGEVALIIASIGLSAGLLTDAYFTSVIIAVIVSTIASPPLLKLLFK
jgi:Kef-type K+ transport system membrane component KefB